MTKGGARFFLTASLLALTASAQAGETVTYGYDSLGRLTKVEHAGSVNNGVNAHYCYDSADNRTLVTANQASAPQCPTSSAPPPPPPTASPPPASPPPASPPPASPPPASPPPASPPPASPPPASPPPASPPPASPPPPGPPVVDEPIQQKKSAPASPGGAPPPPVAPSDSSDPDSAPSVSIVFDFGSGSVGFEERSAWTGWGMAR